MAPTGHVNNKKLTVLLVRRVLHLRIKNIERQYLFISTIWKDQNSWKYEDKLLRALRKLRRRLSFVSIHRNNALI